MAGPVLLLLSAVLAVAAAWQLVRLGALLVALVCQLAWLSLLILVWPVRAMVRLGRRDAPFLALAVALLALPALARARQPGQAMIFGADGGYRGQLVQSHDGQQVIRTGPTGSYQGSLQREQGGWIAIGKDGGYRGRVQPGPSTSPQ